MTQYNGSHEVMGPHTPGRIDDAGTLQMAGGGHTHVEADITDLQSYSLAGHTHVEVDITDLGNYSVVGHTHTEGDITDLDAYLPRDGSEIMTGSLELQVTGAASRLHLYAMSSNTVDIMMGVGAATALGSITMNTGTNDISMYRYYSGDWHVTQTWLRSTGQSIFPSGLSLTGPSSNIQLGGNYISYGGTDAGFTLNSSNHATFSGNLGCVEITASDDVNCLNVVATGNLDCVEVTATDDVNCVNVVASGNVNCVEITATDDVNCVNVIASVDVSCVDLDVTDIRLANDIMFVDGGKAYFGGTSSEADGLGAWWSGSHFYMKNFLADSDIYLQGIDGAAELDLLHFDVSANTLLSEVKTVRFGWDGSIALTGASYIQMDSLDSDVAYYLKSGNDYWGMIMDVSGGEADDTFTWNYNGSNIMTLTPAGNINSIGSAIRFGWNGTDQTAGVNYVQIDSSDNDVSYYLKSGAVLWGMTLDVTDNRLSWAYGGTERMYLTAAGSLDIDANFTAVDMTASGDIQCGSSSVYKSGDGSSGVDGTISTGAVAVVKDGIITSITPPP